MPNYCSNKLNVSGDKFQDEMKSFLAEAIKENKFRLSHTHPMPEVFHWKNISEEDQKMLLEKYGSSNWNDWRIANYGTKWDCEDDYLDTDHCTFLHCEFDSAWTPPLKWLEYVSKKYPNLNFRLEYIESGVFFCGVATAKDGVLIDTEVEPVYILDGIELKYDSDKEVFSDENGNEYTWEDGVEIINPLSD